MTLCVCLYQRICLCPYSYAEAQHGRKSIQTVRRSDGHKVVIRRARDQVVRWSSAQIAKWSVIRSHGQSVRRLSGQLRSVLLASGVILHLWDALDVVHESASAAVVPESASAAVHECTCT